MSMNAQFSKTTIELTPAFIAAAESLMREHLAMIRQRVPDEADFWTWGECRVHDLASGDALEFRFGGDEDKPWEGEPDVRIVAAAETKDPAS